MGEPNFESITFLISLHVKFTFSDRKDNLLIPPPIKKTPLFYIYYLESPNRWKFQCSIKKTWFILIVYVLIKKSLRSILNYTINKIHFKKNCLAHMLMKNRQSIFSFIATVSSCFNRQIMYIRNNNFFLKYLKYIYIYLFVYL